MDHSVSLDRQSSRQDTPPQIFINNEKSIDYDIYRGDPAPAPQTPKQESIASQSSFSTVSSNSFRLTGGRIGALATRLERAITRWARTNWADSSSSMSSDVSSTSSRSSFRTANKTMRRKRRPPSLADLQHRAQSERAVAARIRARELRRTVPREFNLYIPPLCPSQDVGPIEEEGQDVRTFSLDEMLPHLESVLPKYSKPHRSRHRARTQRAELDQPRHSHNLLPPQANPSRAGPVDGISREEKGKHKLLSTAPPPNPPQAKITSPRDLDPPQAWWLDVASPSWEDMRTLGKVSKHLVTCGHSG
jgi:magnesium transporter